MKHIAIVLGLALSPLAYAQAPTAEHMELCKSVEEASTSLMKARQKGVEMSKVMEATMKNMEKASPEMRDAFVQMVVEAYEESAMTMDDNKARQVRDFSNRQYLACIRG